MARSVHELRSDDPRPRMSATVGPLATAAEPLPLREALAWASAAGFAAVQLSATDPAMRPRDQSDSARRDLRATLARLELCCSGIDLFVPPGHFTDPALVGRAVEAVLATLRFAADLGLAPIVVPFPAATASDVRGALAAEASKLGVAILVPIGSALPETAADKQSEYPHERPFFPCIDCAAVLAEGARPEDVVSRLASGSSGILGGVRVVDLLRSGMRGPILEPHESRLDVMALKVSLEIARHSGRFSGVPIFDARQWANPREGLERSLARWISAGI